MTGEPERARKQSRDKGKMEGGEGDREVVCTFWESLLLGKRKDVALADRFVVASLCLGYQVVSVKEEGLSSAQQPLKTSTRV
jgi:hypothetical protein